MIPRPLRDAAVGGRRATEEPPGPLRGRGARGVPRGARRPKKKSGPFGPLFSSQEILLSNYGDGSVVGAPTG